MKSAAWSDHLESIARPVLAETPLFAESSPADALAFVDGFADELGHRRRVDRPLLLRLLGLNGHLPEKKPGSVDESIWWALHAGETMDGFIEPGPGPIIGQAEFASGAIETTTETELSSLHALARHACESQNDLLRDRCEDAARWHVDTLQPDNGTNHPWAIHAFVWLAESDPEYAASGSLHAECLLHNSIVRTGRPDRFSACVLLDASRALAKRSETTG